MRKRESIGITFGLLVFFLILIFLLRDSKLVIGIRGVLEKGFAPFEGAALQFSRLPSSLFDNREMKKLHDENRQLLTQRAQFLRLQEDNRALSDQFQIESPSPQKLLPSRIIGMPSFVPGIFSPEQLIIDKGSAEGVAPGYAVIEKEDLLGTVVHVSLHRSLVRLVWGKDSSFTAKTSKTQALGVVKGVGEAEMVLQNVVLSDLLIIGDLVVTLGDENEKGAGLPPGLIVGKIVGVDKKASNLFQSAQVKSLVDVGKLSLVFILMP